MIIRANGPIPESAARELAERYGRPLLAVVAIGEDGLNFVVTPVALGDDPGGVKVDSIRLAAELLFDPESASNWRAYSRTLETIATLTRERDQARDEADAVAGLVIAEEREPGPAGRFTGRYVTPGLPGSALVYHPSEESARARVLADARSHATRRRAEGDPC